MQSTRVGSIFALAASVAALAVAGCGATAPAGSDASTTGGGTSTAPTAGRHFPVLRVTWAPPDYVDPAVAWSTGAWGILWNTHIGLVTYPHLSGNAGAQPVPGLAKAMPAISNGGKTFTFHLRSGLRYSNGQRVKASDFIYTVKRAFRLNTPNGGIFSGIIGAQHFMDTKKGNIPGISADDATGTIVIRLTAPQANFLYALAFPWFAFVPPNTPVKVQNGPVAGVGPYRLTAYTPNRSFTLERNPYFKGLPGVPVGNPDKVVGTIESNPTVSLQDVLNGQSDYDFNEPPLDRLAGLQSQYPSQVKIYTVPNTVMFFLNERTAPFDELDVRRAVEYGVDRAAIVRLYGGLADPTENLFPSYWSSYRKITAYTYDPNMARQLIKKAGAVGTPVTVWSDDTEQGVKVNTYLVNQLNAIGLKAKLKVVSASVYYQTVGNQKTKAQVVWANFFADYPQPVAKIDQLFNGHRILPTGNYNFGNVNFPEINNEIEALKKEPVLTPSVAARWAEVDRQLVVDKAAVVPVATANYVSFFGPSIDPKCYVNSQVYLWDFDTTCKK